MPLFVLRNRVSICKCHLFPVPPVHSKNCFVSAPYTQVFLKTLAVKLIPLNHLEAYKVFKFDS